ncbi:DNA damage-regulated autophagy modulator protein [Dermatophagoides pteronyssinus]|uniref:DNA damage-regulated autophagy modulator protein n=1 Tax=Dermatophagoides pteronyssinus TaxID=6956 RepID=A0ABQ8J4B2_DERPT|nr:DNA damage-regulated autophagy modulator protein [Dermatophagoides pteronyssinus]
MLSTNIDLEKQQQQQQTTTVKNPFDYFQKYYQYVWIFSFTIPLTFPLILILSYYITVSNDFVDPLFPYISDIVGHPPVACYFSMFIDLLSILAFITGFFRYKQLQFLLINKNFDENDNDSKKQCLQNLNYNSLISLWITSFGLLMIGNFRETENILIGLRLRSFKYY